MKSYFSIPGIRSEFKIHEGKPCTAFYRSSRQKAPANSNRELAGHATSERSERV